MNVDTKQKESLKNRKSFNMRTLGQLPNLQIFVKIWTLMLSTSWNKKWFNWLAIRCFEHYSKGCPISFESWLACFDTIQCRTIDYLVLSCRNVNYLYFSSHCIENESIFSIKIIYSIFYAFHLIKIIILQIPEGSSQEIKRKSHFLVDLLVKTNHSDLVARNIKHQQKFWLLYQNDKQTQEKSAEVGILIIFSSLYCDCFKNVNKKNMLS